MPARRYRSSTYKERRVRVAGGRVAKHYREKKNAAAICANCGRPLCGVPRVGGVGMRAIPRSYRFPNRPFGGYLCVRCSRRSLLEKIRA
ncbi:MAG: 50S ribosomal protein L34e [Candidatus Hadarchaeaceae archaeon]